jgi:tetratricopeptide (TPR) repeat protein
MFAEATSVLERSTIENPTDANAHLLLGKAYLGTMKPDSAEEEFSRARLLNPQIEKEAFRAYYDVGQVFLSKKNQSEVMAGYVLLLAGVEKDPSLGPQVALLLKEKGKEFAEKDASAARELLEKAIELDSVLQQDEDTQLNLARSTSDPKQRIAAFQRFIAAFPNSKSSASAFLQIATAHYDLGEYPDAKARIEYLKSNYADTPSVTEAESLLRSISQQEAEMARAEAEKQAAVARAEGAKAEAQRTADLERARRQAEAEKAAVDAQKRRASEEAARRMRIQELRTSILSAIADGREIYGESNAGMWGKSKVVLRITSFDSTSGSFGGVYEDPNHNSSIKVAGTLSEDTVLTFEAGERIVGDWLIPTCRYRLSPEDGSSTRIKGTISGRVGSQCAHVQDLPIHFDVE